jgi:hypothetical protein
MWQNISCLVIENFVTSCVICCGINNDLWTLNMDLANIVVNSSIM